MDSNEPGWTFQPGQTVAPGGTATAPAPQQPLPATQAAQTAPVAKSGVSWTASEFISYQKSGGWYFIVLLIALVIATLVYFFTKDVIASITVIAAAILFLVYAGRKPRVLNYAINNSGVQIAEKVYPYGQFRSFSVIDEGSMHSIMLVPLKRVSPTITMYFEPIEEEKIINELSKYLPHEEREQDTVDKIMHRIRF